MKVLNKLFGWIGLVLIHGATIPTTLGIVMGYSENMPPMNMVLMVWTGLFLFLIDAFKKRDMLYIISNAIGFFFNSILLALIVFKG